MFSLSKYSFFIVGNAYAVKLYNIVGRFNFVIRIAENIDFLRFAHDEQFRDEKVLYPSLSSQVNALSLKSVDS